MSSTERAEPSSVATLPEMANMDPASIDTIVEGAVRRALTNSRPNTGLDDAGKCTRGGKKLYFKFNLRSHPPTFSTQVGVNFYLVP